MVKAALVKINAALINLWKIAKNHVMINPIKIAIMSTIGNYLRL